MLLFSSVSNRKCSRCFLSLSPPTLFSLPRPIPLPGCRLFVFNLVLMPSSIIVKIITLNVNAESESKQQPSTRRGNTIRREREKCKTATSKQSRERQGKCVGVTVGEEKTRAAQQENGKYVSSGYKEKWVPGSGRWFKRVVIIKFYTYTHIQTHTHTQTLAHSYATTHTHTHT